MKKVVLILVGIMEMSIPLLSQNEAGSDSKGKTLFTTRCAACHSIKQKLVGPALRDVNTRRSEEWIIKFVQNSQAMIQANDPQAVAIFQEFNQTMMTPNPDLSTDDIKHIIAYIKAESEKLAPTTTTNTSSATQPVPTSSQEQESSYTFIPWYLYWVFGGLVVALLLALHFFIDIKSKP